MSGMGPAHEARVFIDGNEHSVGHESLVLGVHRRGEEKATWLVYLTEPEEWLDEWMKKKELGQAACELFSDEA